MSKLILKYALILFVALSLLKFLEFRFFSHKMSLEIYLGIVSIGFLLAGIIISKYWYRYDKLLNKTPNAVIDKSESQIDSKRLSEFSEREQQVLQLLCHGYTNKEIANILNISPNTVKTHLSKLFNKLGVSNRTQALSEAKLLKIIN